MAGFDERPEALARWLGEQMAGPPVPFEKVEPGDEQKVANDGPVTLVLEG